MAENGNGKGLFTFVGSIIAGSLGIVAMIYNLVYAPLSGAISQECQSRTEGDTRIEAKLDKILDNTMVIKETLASTSTQVSINTKRLERLEAKVQ